MKEETFAEMGWRGAGQRSNQPGSGRGGLLTAHPIKSGSKMDGPCRTRPSGTIENNQVLVRPSVRPFRSCSMTCLIFLYVASVE